jgi:uncharacterized protein (TIGR03067 family)
VQAAAPAPKKTSCGTVVALVSAVALVLLCACGGVGFVVWAGLRNAAGQVTALQAKLATEAVKPPPVPVAGKEGPATPPRGPANSARIDQGRRETAPAKPPADKPPVPDPAKEGGPQNDLAALQQTWRAWRAEDSRGIDAAPGDGMVIEGNTIQFLWAGNNNGATATFTLDPAKEPKQINVDYTSGSPIGKKQLGIYRLSGAQLEISWAGIGDGKRPGKFTGRLTPAAGQSYVIYRSPDFKEDPAVAEETKRLEGRWDLNPNGDGLLIEGYDLKFLSRNRVGVEARFLVDPSKDPKEIEVIYTVGSGRYQKRLGIYKLDGDTLTLSLSDFNVAKPPTKFAGNTTPGGGSVYGVYHREKEK